jgi:hypothetical protein
VAQPRQNKNTRFPLFEIGKRTAACLTQARKSRRVLLISSNRNVERSKVGKGCSQWVWQEAGKREKEKREKGEKERGRTRLVSIFPLHSLSESLFREIIHRLSHPLGLSISFSFLSPPLSTSRLTPQFPTPSPSPFPVFQSFNQSINQSNPPNHDRQTQIPIHNTPSSAGMAPASKRSSHTEGMVCLFS